MNSKIITPVFLISSILDILSYLTIYIISPSFDLMDTGFTPILLILLVFIIISLIASITGFLSLKPIFKESLTVKGLLYIILFIASLYILFSSLFILISIRMMLH